MKSILMLIAISLVPLCSAQAATIQEACVEVQMNCGYNSRYDLIDTIYKATGKALFDRTSNPYTRDMKDEEVRDMNTGFPRFYIGSGKQNQRLARNILANKQLFVNGRLSVANAKKWKFIN